MPQKIMVAGHVCLDITPVFDIGQITRPNEALSPGKLLTVGKADIHTGGAVSNTGLAMRFFGLDAALVAKTGADAFGKIIREIFERHGCSENLIEDGGTDTSYTVVIAMPGFDRIFLHNPGANDSFGEQDVTDEALKDVIHFHFGYPPIMRRMYEDNGRELLRLFSRVKAMRITTSLDMAGVDPSTQAGAADWKEILSNLLPLVDFFLPSAEEICAMTDAARFNEWEKRAKGADITQALNPEADIRPLAEELIRMGTKVALIKCGSPGIYYKTGEGSGFDELCAKRGLNKEEWENLEGFEASYKPDRVVSATGAGDTSIAAFLTSMLSGHGLNRCVKLACAAGACCVSAYDALSGLEPLDTLWEKIERGWEKAR